MCIRDSFQAELRQVAGQLLGRRLHLVVAHGERQHAHVRRRHRERPRDAVLVVVLLHDGRHGARHAHAVAAHEERLLGTVFRHERGAHGLRVLVAQLEHLRHLDAARALQRQAALRAAVAGLHDAEVGPLVHLEVHAQLGAHVVVAVLVRAHDPLRHGLQAARRDDACGLGQADRAHGALVQAEGLHVLVGEQREAAGHTLGLQLVQLVVCLLYTSRCV